MSAEPEGEPDWLDALRDLAPVEPTDPWGEIKPTAPMGTTCTSVKISGPS